jgi:hypothetical protein
MSPTLQNQNKSKLLVKTGNIQVQREHKYDWDYVETGSNSKFNLRIFANSWRRLPVANSNAAEDFPSAEVGMPEIQILVGLPLDLVARACRSTTH